MDARDIHSKWVVNLEAQDPEASVWLGWSALARLRDSMTELSTHPNTFVRVAFSQSTFESLGELLTRAVECHATEDPHLPHPRPLSTERLASAANELHQQAQFLQTKLAEPGATHVTSRQEVAAHQSFIDEWKTIQAQLGMRGGPRPPLHDCSGSMTMSLIWGW
ncbi:hypothetical protein HUA74_01520 [Myxococcus sp. CA051A]|uniref:hypothetical protein n=1 Tax=unclassified Myxococcus TaxID=2648731 RepID=UPI00157B5A2E|nr:MULTISPECIES: hypothetical protein [unclassified Myxococcus]NTX33564.1 hypothetical protein [Myxococcus sp. CA033]NTX59329.1 hypothetical protein [Myxococcus sp. CA051A]